MGQQNDPARAIFDPGKPTIVFLLNGRPLAINVLQARANAIIEGWCLGRPLLELKAFRRATLAAGASAWLHFTLAPDDLAFYDTSMRRVVEPGTFTISVGPNSVALKAVTLTVVPA